LKGRENNIKKFMDIKEIKEIIKETGGKFIIVENDEPVFVITSFEDFKKGFKKKENIPIQDFEPQIPGEEEGYEEKEVQNEIPDELKDEPLKIEDIPF